MGFILLLFSPDFGLSLNITWFLWLASLAFSAISVAGLLNQINCDCGYMCSTGLMSMADDFQNYFSFIFCILDWQILLISTFYAKSVMLHLHRLFKFNSIETKMKTLPGGRTVSSIPTWWALSGHLRIALLRLFLMQVSTGTFISYLLVSYLPVSLYRLFSSEGYKNCSFRVVLASVVRFLSTYYDGLFSPQRGIPPLSIYCLVIRWCIWYLRD